MKPPPAAAMAGAWQVVPMDIRRYRDVGRANDAEARHVRRHLFTIELDLTEGFKDLRTCTALIAAVGGCRRRKVTGLVREVRPPDRGFVAAHVEVGNDGRLRKTLVHPQHPAVDLRVGAVKDNAVLPRCGLVEVVALWSR